MNDWPSRPFAKPKSSKAWSRRTPTGLWAAYRAILKDRLPLLPVDRRVAEAYAKLAAQLRQQGRPRPPFDLLIAATARAHSLTVATLNTVHFGGIEGVRIEDWNKPT